MKSNPFFGDDFEHARNFQRRELFQFPSIFGQFSSYLYYLITSQASVKLPNLYSIRLKLANLKNEWLAFVFGKIDMVDRVEL